MSSFPAVAACTSFGIAFVCFVLARADPAFDWLVACLLSVAPRSAFEALLCAASIVVEVCFVEACSDNDALSDCLLLGCFRVEGDNNYAPGLVLFRFTFLQFSLGVDPAGVVRYGCWKPLSIVLNNFL